MKIRVIPSILTNGISQVKGERFDNWRTVGTVEQAVRVQARRDVDEIVLLDVKATEENRLISLELVQSISYSLRIPLTVGGGIKSVADVASLLASGADKIILGTAAQPKLVSELARNFGSQAIVCAVDASGQQANFIAINSGKVPIPGTPMSFTQDLVSAGAGEILLQHVDRDGTMTGLNLELIRSIAHSVTVPVLASSGISSTQDAVSAAQSGAAAIVAGALLQFTQTTPLEIKKALSVAGFDVRK